VAQRIKPLVNRPGDLIRALEDAGWMSEEVRAAALLRQGHSPSMASAMMGHGLVSLLKPRAARELPRTFVLALTAREVVAFKARGVTHGEGSDEEYYVTIWSEPVARWSADEVGIEPAKKGIDVNAIVRLRGTREIPVSEQIDGTLGGLVAGLGPDAPPA
jgi:hypothetical protein